MIKKKKSILLEQFMNSFSDQDKTDIMDIDDEYLAFNNFIDNKKKNKDNVQNSKK